MYDEMQRPPKAGHAEWMLVAVLGLLLLGGMG